MKMYHPIPTFRHYMSNVHLETLVTSFWKIPIGQNQKSYVTQPLGPWSVLVDYCLNFRAVSHYIYELHSHRLQLEQNTQLKTGKLNQKKYKVSIIRYAKQKSISNCKTQSIRIKLSYYFLNKEHTFVNLKKSLCCQNLSPHNRYLVDCRYNSNSKCECTTNTATNKV